MPLYQRTEDIEEDNDDLAPKVPDTPQTVTDDSGNWKKRYSDLRSYSQKQVNDLNKRIQELENTIKAAPRNQLPKTKAEIEEWSKKYPDVYALIKSMINIDLNEVTDEVEQKFKSLETREAELSQDRAKAQLERLHPDFFTDIEPSKEFREWLGTKSLRVQNAMYEGDDPVAAGEVITLYKLETGFGNKTTTKRDSNRDAARDVRVPATRNPPNPNSGDFDFSESQIEQMSPRDYEENEDAIDKARRNGRILMDLTGDAR